MENEKIFHWLLSPWHSVVLISNALTDGFAKTDLTPASGVEQPRETARGFAGAAALLREVSTLNELIEMILIRFGAA